MWWYYYWFVFMTIILIIFQISDWNGKLYSILGVQKNVYYNGEYSSLRTGKSQGVLLIIFGFIVLGYTVPLLRDTMEFAKMFTMSVWPMTFIIFYVGCIELLRPHTFGEESRCDVPCDDYAKDALLEKSMPLSYAELLLKAEASLLMGSPVHFCLTVINPFNFPTILLIILWAIYIAVLLAFTFMDKINEYLSKHEEKILNFLCPNGEYDKFDIRYPPGYYSYLLCAYILPLVPMLIGLGTMFIWTDYFYTGVVYRLILPLIL